MSEELKPCPFCNGRPRLVAPVWDLLPYCECLRCGVKTSMAMTNDEAIAAWNRRASPTPPTTEGREEREGEREEALELARYLARRFEEDGDARNVPMTELMLARALLSSPRVEELDEHIGALLRIYEDADVPDAKDRERVQEIATAFGERCLSAALSP